MKSFGVFLIVLSVAAFIACAVFASQSYDKYAHYSNSENYYIPNVNAYVGGDAYNYIINGTYFTAFAVYAVGCGLAGAFLLGMGGLLIGLAGRREHTPAAQQTEQPTQPTGFSTNDMKVLNNKLFPGR